VRSLARLALGSTAARKRAILALAAVPLAAAFVAGVAVGVGAESGGFATVAIVASVPISLAVAFLLASWLFAAAQSVRRSQSAFWILEKIAPLRLDVRADAPARINILHPEVDLRHFFGGFIAVFNLARRLSERGHRVRLVALEGDPPRDWRERLAAYEGLGGSLERLEVVSAGDRSRPIDASAHDALVATHWTAAHVAARALDDLTTARFLYLIQEYEPLIFPASSAAALARESYDLPHAALFSSAPLRDWFRKRAIGVFANGPEHGERCSTFFENAITPVGPVEESELRRSGPRRFLFYARPEAHAARNLFEIAAMALDDAIAGGRFAGWELAGIGTVDRRGRWLELPRSRARLRLLPRTGQTDYARVLRSSDVGLALMHTPHPSLVPIEMAAAGMPTVTSTFGSKDAATLGRISSNLIAAEPHVAAVSEALARAERQADDLAGRARGSDVRWPRSWNEALADDVMERVERLLGLSP
jgi:hypothetical protein